MAALPTDSIKTNARLKVGFIGLGLIGGSIAKALKAAITDIRLTAYDTDKETLALARKEGVAYTVTDTIVASLWE